MGRGEAIACSLLVQMDEFILLNFLHRENIDLLDSISK